MTDIFGHRSQPNTIHPLKVLKNLFFLEHGISPDQKVARWQRRLNRLQKCFADGCTLTLDVRTLLATQPFRCVEISNFYMEKTPRTHGYMFRGTAAK